MARVITVYEGEETPFAYNICFLNEAGQKLVRSFESPYMARKFINTLKRSKRCVLVSYPINI